MTLPAKHGYAADLALGACYDILHDFKYMLLPNLPVFFCHPSLFGIGPY